MCVSLRYDKINGVNVNCRRKHLETNEGLEQEYVREDYRYEAIDA